jgi:hypothetical protein
VPKLIDQSNDLSFRKLASILKNYPQEVTGLIKTASTDPELNSALPDTAFADTNGRQFPINTASDAALSYLYASEPGVPSTIKTAVQAALDLYGVVIPTVKTAAAVDDNFYLLPSQNRWAARDEETVKLAAEAIEREIEMPVTDRVQAAVRLMTKAAKLNLPVSATIEKLAGVVKSDLNATREWLEARSMACDKPEFAQAYRTMSDKLATVKVTESNDRKSLIKLAQAISDLDEKADLTKYYGRVIPDAVQTVFNTTKLAQEEVDVAGRPVEMSRLLGSPPDLYGDIFGEDFQNSVAADGDLDPDALSRELPSMPRDLQRIFLDELGLRR